jgi:hypothetical protein
LLLLLLLLFFLLLLLLLTLAEGVKTAWGDVESVRSDCSAQLAAAALAISEMKSKLTSLEHKDVMEVKQGQQHAELLLKDIERRVGQTEEAIKVPLEITTTTQFLNFILSAAHPRPDRCGQ